MATEIQIADKPTLDAIKAFIGGANPSVDGTDTLFNYLHSLASKSSRRSYKCTFSTTSTTLQTALNLTGGGCIDGLHVLSQIGATGNKTRIKITVDGVVLEDRLMSDENVKCFCISRGSTNPSLDAGVLSAGSDVTQVPIYFNESLLVEIGSSIGTNNAILFACSYSK